MKTSNRNKLLSLALVGSCSLFSASNVLAAAGDTISNTATLNYTVGGAGQTPIADTTNFLEDRKINFTVDRTATKNVGPTATAQAVEFTITNNSNAPLNFLLRAEHLLGVADPFGGGGNDIFTPTSIQAFVEDGTTAGYQPLEDTAIHVSDVAASGGTATVYVVSDIPATRTDLSALVDGDIAVVALVAQAALPTTPINGEVAGTGIATDALTNDDNGRTSPGGTFQVTVGSTTVNAGAASNTPDTAAGMETVYASLGNAKGGSSSTPQTGEQSDASTYTSIVAALTVTKSSQVIYDDINDGVNVINANPKAIPGAQAIIRYTVQVDNAAGSGDAVLTTITDDPPLQLDTQFGAGTTGNPALPAAGTNNVRIVDGASTTTFCTADGNAADGCTWDGTTLSVDLGTAAGTATLSASQSLTIEFDVRLP